MIVVIVCNQIKTPHYLCKKYSGGASYMYLVVGVIIPHHRLSATCSETAASRHNGTTEQSTDDAEGHPRLSQCIGLLARLKKAS
jgi:hypothetical protein